MVQDKADWLCVWWEDLKKVKGLIKTARQGINNIWMTFKPIGKDLEV